jgi:hypothetical protein
MRSGRSAQLSSEKSLLSAEQQQVGSDQQQISTLQSTVNSQLVSGLSLGKYSYVCSNSDVQFGSQLVTAYYPCTDKNPN